jgi:hypothetical protein
MNSNSYEVKKTLESDLSGPRKPGFSPVSCCLSHDVSKSPRFLLDFPGRANGSDLAQRARYAGKTSTSSASITSRRDTLQLAAGRVHYGDLVTEKGKIIER